MRPSDEETARDAPAAAANGPKDPAAHLSRADRQRIWLHLQSRPWRTLAMVPAEAGVSASHAARVLAAIAGQNGEVLDLFDARGTELDHAAAEVAAAAGGSRRVLVVTPAVDEDLTTIPLAQAADAVLLCVSIGSTSLRAAGDVTAAIGKDRFLASLSLRPLRPRPRPLRALLPALLRVLKLRGSEA